MPRSGRRFPHMGGSRMALLRATALKNTKISINGDFSVIVPEGMTWSMQPEQIGKQWLVVFMSDQRADFSEPLKAGRSFAVGHPQPLREKNFADPVTRGAIRNFAAGAMEGLYGQEVRQVVVTESPDLMVLYARKVGTDGAVRFVVAASKGLYVGLICPDARTEKERFEIVTEYLKSIEKYTAPVAAVPKAASRHQEKAENTKAAGTETAAAASAAEAPSAASAEVLKKNEEPAVQESAVAAPSAAGEKGSAGEAKENAAEAGKAAVKTPGDKPKVTLEIPIVAPGDDTLKIANAMVEQLVAEVESDAKAAKEAGGKLDVYDKQIERMKELEKIRADKIAEIRSHYKGNQDVESQIDNYIPRVQRSADRACEEFQKFLVQMQNFIAQIPLTGPEDPTYLEISQRLEDAQDTMGRQLDEMVIGVDENAANSRKAGVTEYYIERMIRLIERLEEKYDELDVRMYDGSTMQYHKPADVLKAIAKWKNVRYELPTYIERSEREVEKRMTEEVTRRIERTKVALRNQETYIELKIDEVSRAEDEAAAIEGSLEEFEDAFETRKSEAEAAGAQMLVRNEEEVRALEEEASREEKELEELNEELSKTFALNVSRRKDLSGRIDVQNGRIEELRARIQAARKKRETLEQSGAKKLEELKQERSRIEKKKEEAKSKVDALSEELDQAEKRLSELRKTLTDSEEELGKIHENYLLGKYDPVIKKF